MKTVTFDVAVLGGGGAGLVAAARIRQMTGKRVAVLEKAKATGGGMQFARTMRVFRSKWQAERGLEDKTAEFMRGVMDLCLWRVDPELARAAIEGTGQFFDWFCGLQPGLAEKFSVGGYIFDMPNGQKGPDLEGSAPGTGAGRLIMDVMRQTCQTLGVEILTQTAAYDAELTDGRLSAILARQGDETIRVACSSVVIASGSWISNPALVEKFMPKFASAEILPTPHTNPAYTGDGLAIAQKLGSPLDEAGCCIRLMGPMMAGKSQVLDAAANSPFAIGVNVYGRRFVSEPMVPRMDFFDTGHVLVDQPRAVSYWIIDRAGLRAAVERARAVPPEALGPFPPYQYPDSWEQIDADIEAALDGKRTFRADTPEELARQLCVDEKGLCKTIADYNEFCRTGMDWDGYKDSADLVAMTGPYYAVRAYLGTDGAFGGIRINEKMQALDADGRPVPGVYAAGDITGSRHIVAAGVKRQILNDMSWAFSSGFVAGTCLAEELT